MWRCFRFLSAATMTKLQLLSGVLTERLTALVTEVLDVVEEALSESREEAARCREEAARYREENGRLRRQLRDLVLLEAQTQWLSKAGTESSHPASERQMRIRTGSEPGSFKSLSARLLSLGSRDVLARRLTVETSLSMRGNR